MKCVVQRVSEASVKVNGIAKGSINKGFVVLVGIKDDDTLDDVKYCVKKVSGLRVFEDQQGKMNLNLDQINGQILSISQFTLYGDTRKGNRPSFIEAARPEKANELYNVFNHQLEELGYTVATGQFQADMKVSLVNDGPVTIIIDSKG